jgi:hypothetical protein
MAGDPSPEDCYNPTSFSASCPRCTSLQCRRLTTGLMCGGKLVARERHKAVHLHLGGRVSLGPVSDPLSLRCKSTPGFVEQVLRTSVKRTTSPAQKKKKNLSPLLCVWNRSMPAQCLVTLLRLRLYLQNCTFASEPVLCVSGIEACLRSVWSRCCG